LCVALRAVRLLFHASADMDFILKHLAALPLIFLQKKAHTQSLWFRFAEQRARERERNKDEQTRRREHSGLSIFPSFFPTSSLKFAFQSTFMKITYFSNAIPVFDWDAGLVKSGT
jgi:hypothetical protein